ncbi:MAG: purine-nucleoside phosphorylase [Synergistaceae bacterium]|jgi:purine-nucleoside phosphorylase|nr:purine-nucleoside phosphorylase [Synergistaceae bacterium]
MNNMAYRGQVLEAAACLRSKLGGFRPKTAVVLGSGLGRVTELLNDPVVIESADIPHWPRSTAPGHAGKVVAGTMGGRPVLVFKGRVHYYEGYGMKEVTFPTRVAGALGVRQYVATNASGGIDGDLNTGSLVLVEDHINYMGDNPLIGPTDPTWNERFPSMTRAYSQRLIGFFEDAAAALHIRVRRGVYIAFSGPSYETPAEIRMARTMGASIVGMSTVPEVIVASAMGMETAVLSCVANRAAGLGTVDEMAEEQVLKAIEDACSGIAALLSAFMERLEREGS